MVKPEDSPLLGCCGIYCGVCPSNTGEIRQAAKQLQKLLNETKMGEISFLMGIATKYPTFYEALIMYANQPLCGGCRSGSPTATCAIKKCCINRGFSSCAECEEFEDCTTTPEGFDLDKSIGEIMGETLTKLMQEEQMGLPELPELPKEVFM